jgi:hypothetical protein
MTGRHMVLDALDARVQRRNERRDFFRAVGAAAIATGGLALAARTQDVQAQTAPTDVDILNFALNLEYLEANFYSIAVLGEMLPDNLRTGAGTPVAPTTTGARQVTFADGPLREMAREITVNERTHVAAVRATITQLGGTPIAQPALDLSVSPTSAFSNLARAAGLIGPGETFDPYANENNFIQAAAGFEDVGATAYKGASPLIASKTVLEASAGILAVEAYHASILRTHIFLKGLQAPALLSASEALSKARDDVDGPDDRDQGVAPIGSASNIVPTDGNGITFSRSTGQVLNVVYQTRTAATQGGFFPAGVNGAIRSSSAN